MPILWVLFLFCGNSPAEWTRRVSTVYGDSTSPAPPQPLEYFQLDALLRDDRALEMCARCTTPEKSAMRKKYGVEPKVSRIGRVAGFEIFDIWSCPVAQPPGNCGAKSIVARTAEGYREILYYIRPQVDGRVNPSFLVKAGTETILGAREFVGGNRGLMTEFYFWFDAEGPHEVNYRELWKEVESVPLPQGLRLYGINFVDFNGQVSFPAMRVRVPLRDTNASLCCAEGAVEVDFRFERGRLIPTGKRYLPK
ncbi:MAG: hypothetical protein JST93_08990 [Acidobacteria bacterium]|nr:hypothetical protein [Acidobacteriota bacterium]